MAPSLIVILFCVLEQRGHAGAMGWFSSGGDIDILETRSSPHKGTAIADISSKMITEMAYKW